MPMTHRSLPERGVRTSLGYGVMSAREMSTRRATAVASKEVGKAARELITQHAMTGGRSSSSRELSTPRAMVVREA
jgi:hypothetical protein